MKKGFTLAEVLITLGIIGVVAALAAPALNNATQKAKVGPTLSKFMSTLEVAHEHMLADNQADSISAIVGKNNEVYLTELSKYVKGIKVSEKITDFTPAPATYAGLTNGDGSPSAEVDVDEFTVYSFADGSAMAIWMYEREDDQRGGAYKGNIASLWFDFNGFDNKPNRTGKDEFRFYIDDGGAVYPDGGNVKKQLLELNGKRTNGHHWNEAKGACNETDVKRGGVYCGASVVDNGFKVIYKY